MTLKVKISRNGHFIDDSNKYRFIYVPRNISTKKKAFFMSASASIFFPRNGGDNNACYIIFSVTSAVKHLRLSHWSCTCTTSSVGTC